MAQNQTGIDSPGWRGRNGVRRAHAILLAAAVVCLASLLGVIGCSIQLYAKASDPPPTVSKPSDQPAPAAKEFSAADLQKQVQADVDATIKNEELLLDKLLLIVGLYTTILSFLAVATVVVSRLDAKEQVSKIEKLADDLRTQVRAEFPFISELQGRVLELIRKLEAKYPEDENLNSPRADSWGLEKVHQDVLIDELQIVAVSVVVLDTASLLKLYMVLSRSYFDRFRTGTHTESDAARAYLYASRAIDYSPDYAEGYRMRGVIALSRYRAAPAAQQLTNEFQTLLLAGKSDLNHCLQLDPVNTGGIYNLARLYDMEGDHAKAIGLSEQLLVPKNAKRISRWNQEKYFPDVYVNLACYFADESTREPDQKKKEQLWDKAVKTCEDCKTFLETELKSTRAMNTFHDSLKRELGPTGDFKTLPADRKDKLNLLL